MIWAFDVDMTQEEQALFPRRFFQAALRQEVLMRPIGNTVYLMPPYVMTAEEAVWLADRVKSVLYEVVGV